MGVDIFRRRGPTLDSGLVAYSDGCCRRQGVSCALFG